MTFRLTHTLLAVVAAAALVSAGQAPSADMMFESARKQEIVDGDLEAAIRTYDAIIAAHGADRGVVARALVAKAQCHERLGHAEAQKMYEQVVRQFADQKEAADVARARLATNRPAAAPAGVVNRQLWTGRDVDTLGMVSPDGRHLSFVAWDTGDLAVRELATGAARRLTNKGTWNDSSDFAEESAISPDGTTVAYSWWNDKEGRYDLRLLKLDAAAGASPRVLYDNPDVMWLGPYDWAPDGRSILVQLHRVDRTAQMGLIALRDGSFTPLLSVDWRGSTRAFFSPDGATIAFDLTQGEHDEQRDVFLLNLAENRKITVAPHRAYDAVMGWSPDGKALLFASDRSGSVALWSVPVASGRPAGEPRVVKHDLGPYVESVGVARTGALVYGVRTSAQTIEMASVDLRTGKLLEPPTRPFESYASMIRHPDWSPDGKQVVFVSERSRNVWGLTIRTLDGGEGRQIRTTMNYVQRPRWAPDGSITVQGLDRKGRQGIFRVDAESGETTPLVISEPGTASLGSSWLPDGKSLVYRRSAPKGGGWSIVLRDFATGEDRVLLAAPQLSAPSLSPDGRQIVYVAGDEKQRNESLDVMLIHSGAIRQLVHLNSADPALVNMVAWTPDGQHIIFTKRRPGGETVDDVEAWSVPVAGGTPRQLDPSFPGRRQFRIHPDGRRIIYDSGQNAYEVWTLENFLPAAATSRR